ncbi:uncharacterized protein METZ01_LOCUS260610, partial [marine metagenome]
MSLVSTIFGDVHPRNGRFSGQAADTIDPPTPTLILDNRCRYKNAQLADG